MRELSRRGLCAALLLRVDPATRNIQVEATIANGRVQQSNFNDFQSLRINEAPRVETHLIASGESPGGVGDPGTSCVAAALCNAIFAATGKRVRTLPVSRGLRGSA